MSLLRHAISRLVDLAYPSACAHCSAFTDDAGPLCPDCDGKLRELSVAAACAHCAKPLPYADAPCPRCLGKGLYPYESVVRLCAYADQSKSLIQHIKYHHRWPLADWLTNRFLDQPRLQALLKQIDAILPIPLYRARHRQRGFNQAALIAARIGKTTRLPVINPLARIRDTPSQTHLSFKARMENVRDAFELRKRGAAQIAEKRILIVDDVMTTGATIQAVGRALLPGKPAQLYATVLAVADPTHRDFQSI
jgi:ComF family protein